MRVGLTFDFDPEPDQVVACFCEACQSFRRRI